MAGGWDRIQWFDLMFADAPLLVNAFASCQSRGLELECDLEFLVSLLQVSIADDGFVCVAGVSLTQAVLATEDYHVWWWSQVSLTKG